MANPISLGIYIGIEDGEYLKHIKYLCQNYYFYSDYLQDMDYITYNDIDKKQKRETYRGQSKLFIDNENIYITSKSKIVENQRNIKLENVEECDFDFFDS